MQLAAMALGAVMIVAGVCAFVWPPRSLHRHGRAAGSYVRASSAGVISFGALPIVAGLGLSARSQDAVSAVVVTAGFAAAVWFVVEGMRVRRAEFRERQRQCVEKGAVPPRYFWSPWAIFGWTLALGFPVVLFGGLAVASGIGALIDFETAAEVERASQAFANVIAAGIFALVPVSAAAGLWRWWRSRSERRGALSLAA
ncbi:hypothetical protein [Rhodococcus artemisiae]|uniref:Uncharacterized protein n=1 Tax=Rhodococcus artemisiae TaxID=714159 RepID=A0ABU7LJ19_9NOCA|nr:hypothetical protein [Rhodococcus artemisiae]MEE2061569.1 hypothetical protein [Rhodococcus artemisiae]